MSPFLLYLCQRLPKSGVLLDPPCRNQFPSPPPRLISFLSFASCWSPDFSPVSSRRRAPSYRFPGVASLHLYSEVTSHCSFFFRTETYLLSSFFEVRFSFCRDFVPSKKLPLLTYFFFSSPSPPPLIDASLPLVANESHVLLE